MDEPCRIKSGEVVSIDDPRLLSPDCIIEPGVIIRAGADTSVDDTGKIEPEVKVSPTPKRAKKSKKAPVNLPIVQTVHQDTPPAAVVHPRANAQTVQVEQPVDVQHPDSILNTPMAITAAVVAIASAAVTVSSAGGVSAIQGKIASMSGNKALAASGVAVGTIVAVKEIERKMNLIEADLTRTKDEINSASESIDRIDALLNRLG